MGDSPLTKVNDIRDPENALASIQVKVLGVDGYLLVSSAIRARAYLENLLLEDNRVKDGGM